MIDRCGTDDEAPGRKPFPGNLDAFEAARSTSLVAIGITGCVWVGKYKMLQAIALANGLRRGSGLWSYDRQTKARCSSRERRR